MSDRMAAPSETQKIDVTADELALVDEVSRLGAILWERSEAISGLNTDPKMFSIMLYRRLWSHHRGFIVLWNHSLRLEAAIVLRAGIEAAICIGANYVMRDAFVTLMRQDAAHTLSSQIRLHREHGSMDLVRDGEALLRMLRAGLPEEAKPLKLDWKSLAEHAGHPELYNQHKALSSISSHVTGLSIMRGIADENGVRQDDVLEDLHRKMHLMMMVGAMLHASMLHAAMIGADELVAQATPLVERLNALSFSWPGVNEEDG